MRGLGNRTLLAGDNLRILRQHRCLQTGRRTRHPPRRANRATWRAYHARSSRLSERD